MRSGLTDDRPHTTLWGGHDDRIRLGCAGGSVAHRGCGLGTNRPADLLTLPAHSRQGAPAANGPRRPVLMFSHALGGDAYTGLAEELASRGYVVAGVEHTFDAPVVEFPGGRVETQSPDAVVDEERLLVVRIADTRFVLDQLTALASRHNPDAVPAGLGRILDLTRVGAFGHSLGSRTVVAPSRPAGASTPARPWTARR